MPEYDTLATAFAEFREEQLPQIRPAGLAPVRVKARRRRFTRMAGVSALAVAMVALAVPAVAHWQLIGAPRRETPAAPNVVQPPPPDAPRCTSDSIIVQVTGNGSVGSQPWVVISFINESGGPCELIGYPVITGVNGYLSMEGQPVLDVAFTVYHGPLASHADPGRVPVILQPGLGASFALGTTLGDQDTYDVREVILTMPGDTNHLLVAMPAGMQASTAHGHPIPITVTGVTAGTAGPPQ